MQIKTVKTVIENIVILLMLVMAFILGEAYGKRQKPFGPVDCLAFYLEMFNNCMNNIQPFTSDCPAGVPLEACCISSTITFFCHDFTHPSPTDFYYKHLPSYYSTKLEKE